YINILLNTEKVLLINNILTVTFCWILLIKYLVFPSIFTSLQISAFLKKASNINKVNQIIYKAIQNISLLSIAQASCTITTSRTIYRLNTSRVVIPDRHLTLSRPVLINSATNFFNTLINIYTARAKTWSVTTTITTAVTGFFTILSRILFIFYNNFLLAKLQKVFNTNTSK
ncbi:uncharacterized protein BO87DRAFT_322755, partial [Aspergillus neoniger CBS 115656]